MSIFHLWVGAHDHSLPIEQGRIEMPQVPRHLRRHTLHMLIADSIRQQHAGIFQGSHEVSHLAQGAEVCLCSCVGLAIDVNEAQTA